MLRVGTALHRQRDCPSHARLRVDAHHQPWAGSAANPASAQLQASADRSSRCSPRPLSVHVRRTHIPERLRMSSWIYCGSDAGVDAVATQSLLRSHAAIWCAPPGLRPWPATPEAGEAIWLVWGSTAQNGYRLLGGGILAAAPRQLYDTALLWTDPDCPGMRAEAEGLGYHGGPAASFLRLKSVVFPRDDTMPVLEDVGPLQVGLNRATPKWTERLKHLLPMLADV